MHEILYSYKTSEKKTKLFLDFFIRLAENELLKENRVFRGGAENQAPLETFSMEGQSRCHTHDLKLSARIFIFNISKNLL